MSSNLSLYKSSKTNDFSYFLTTTLRCVCVRKRERERIMVFNATFNYFSVIEFSIGFWNCSDSVVFFFFISFHYIILTSRNGIKSQLQINTIKEQRLHLRSFIHVHITSHHMSNLQLYHNENKLQNVDIFTAVQTFIPNRHRFD